MKMKLNVNESFFPDDELTRHGFISHLKSYIKSLLDNPIKAMPDDYLKLFGIDGKKALSIVLDDNKPLGPLVSRVEKIKTGEDGKDRFYIKYTLLNKENNIYEKMKKLYNKYVTNGKLNEEAECAGATTCDASSGQFSQPLNNKPIKRKTIYITNEQLDYIKEAVQMDTAAGDFGYDAPGMEINNNDPTLDHSNMIEKSRKEGINENELKKLIRQKIYEYFGKTERYDAERFVHWNPNMVIDDYELDELIDRKIVPEALYGDFEIGVKIEYRDNYEIKRYFFGDDYADAIELINTVRNESLKENFLVSLENTLYSENYRDGEIIDYDEYYENDKYDAERDRRF